ncbi:hypothetical protein H9P43_006319 [Blastocladiella emersonii ATCC 22665]|nr:hypothetical protein H9P43_006319 [Blastocladiella emersonii ATCC 22665]
MRRSASSSNSALHDPQAAAGTAVARVKGIGDGAASGAAAFDCPGEPSSQSLGRRLAGKLTRSASHSRIIVTAALSAAATSEQHLRTPKRSTSFSSLAARIITPNLFTTGPVSKSSSSSSVAAMDTSDHASPPPRAALAKSTSWYSGSPSSKPSAAATAAGPGPGDVHARGIVDRIKRIKTSSSTSIMSLLASGGSAGGPSSTSRTAAAAFASAPDLPEPDDAADQPMSVSHPPPAARRPPLASSTVPRPVSAVVLTGGAGVNGPRLIAEQWYTLEADVVARFPECGAVAGPVDIAGLPRTEVKRQETIYELTVTEADYVASLHVLQRVFMSEIVAHGWLSPREVGLLFSNIEMLVHLNAELLRALEERRVQDKCIVAKVGDVFQQLSHYFKMYNAYCNNFQDAMAFLKTLVDTREPVAAFLRDASRRPECAGMDLGSFLLKPVQRLCKYPLLLRQILEHTPSDHADHAPLVEAVAMVEKVVNRVNEGRRFLEDQRRLLEVLARLDFAGAETLGAAAAPRRPSTSPTPSAGSLASSVPALRPARRKLSRTGPSPPPNAAALADPLPPNHQRRVVMQAGVYRVSDPGPATDGNTGGGGGGGAPRRRERHARLAVLFSDAIAIGKPRGVAHQLLGTSLAEIEAAGTAADGVAFRVRQVVLLAGVVAVTDPATGARRWVGGGEGVGAEEGGAGAEADELEIVVATVASTGGGGGGSNYSTDDEDPAASDPHSGSINEHAVLTLAFATETARDLWARAVWDAVCAVHAAAPAPLSPNSTAGSVDTTSVPVHHHHHHHVVGSFVPATPVRTAFPIGAGRFTRSPADSQSASGDASASASYPDSALGESLGARAPPPPPPPPPPPALTIATAARPETPAAETSAASSVPDSPASPLAAAVAQAAAERARRRTSEGPVVIAPRLPSPMSAGDAVQSELAAAIAARGRLRAATSPEASASAAASAVKAGPVRPPPRAPSPAPAVGSPRLARVRPAPPRPPPGVPDPPSQPEETKTEEEPEPEPVPVSVKSLASRFEAHGGVGGGIIRGPRSTSEPPPLHRGPAPPPTPPGTSPAARGMSPNVARRNRQPSPAPTPAPSPLAGGQDRPAA